MDSLDIPRVISWAGCRSIPIRLFEKKKSEGIFGKLSVGILGDDSGGIPRKLVGETIKGIQLVKPGEVSKKKQDYF